MKWAEIDFWPTCDCLGGGFKDFFIFTPKFGEDSQFDSYFSKGLKPPTSCVCPLIICDMICLKTMSTLLVGGWVSRVPIFLAVQLQKHICSKGVDVDQEGP